MKKKILEISVGSISGLKSILLLVDLCTCRISDQNQNLKWFTLGDFWFIKYKYTQVSWYCCLGLINGPGVIVVKFGVYVIWSHSTSFMIPLPGIN